MKTTKWITGVEPVRKGVYQRRYSWGINYAYFDGINWGLAGRSAQEAHLWGRSSMRTFGGLPWRGLISKGGA